MDEPRSTTSRLKVSPDSQRCRFLPHQRHFFGLPSFVPVGFRHRPEVQLLFPLTPLLIASTRFLLTRPRRSLPQLTRRYNHPLSFEACQRLRSISASSSVSTATTRPRRNIPQNRHHSSCFCPEVVTVNRPACFFPKVASTGRPRSPSFPLRGLS